MHFKSLIDIIHSKASDTYHRGTQEYNLKYNPIVEINSIKYELRSAYLDDETFAESIFVVQFAILDRGTFVAALLSLDGELISVNTSAATIEKLNKDNIHLLLNACFMELLKACNPDFFTDVPIIKSKYHVIYDEITKDIDKYIPPNFKNCIFQSIQGTHDNYSDKICLNYVYLISAKSNDYIQFQIILDKDGNYTIRQTSFNVETDYKYANSFDMNLRDQVLSLLDLMILNIV